MANATPMTEGSGRVTDEQPVNIPRRSFANLGRKTALVVFILAIFTVVIIGLLKAADAVFALGFGILIAAIFDAGARALGLVIHWDRRLRVLIIIIAAFAALAAAVWWGSTLIAAEAQSFIVQMHQLFRRTHLTLHSGSTGWLYTEALKMLPDGTLVFGSASRAVQRFLELLTFFIVALFVGAFCAWEPDVYKAAFLSLLPSERRARVSEVMDEAGHVLRSWIIGRAITMPLVAAFTAGGLLLIHMPNAVLLAVIAGIFSFVPTLGPALAGVVTVLAGLAESGSMALYALGMYLLVQFLESYLITPLVQSRTVDQPPAFGLGLQLIAGVLFGLLGVVVIIPFAAAAAVFVQELYVKDRLGGGWGKEDEARRRRGLIGLLVRSWPQRR